MTVIHPAAGLDPLALVESDPETFPFLLQSNLAGPQGRHDLLFAHPGQRLVLWPDGRLEGPHAEVGGFLAALDAWFSAESEKGRVAGIGLETPFIGGWFLYLGYELAAWIEPVLELPRPRQPIALAVRIPSALVVDRLGGVCRLVDEDEDAVRLASLEQAMAAVRNTRVEATLPGIRGTGEAPNEEFLEGARRILRYIREGDVFQVNLSRRWDVELASPPDPARLYAALRQANPGPFNGVARFGDFSVISSSPERLVEVRDRSIRTRPIAGTRPRGTGRKDDDRLREELRAHPKEQAEHVMLIDLERNDLGRVCRPGSVRVSEFMALETYAHVHHIVSEVSGELRAGVTPGETIRAVFPGGTITGCPKVRCMEIIAELEAEPRSAYTGAMGYLDLRGHLDLNILIRTLVQEEEQVHFRAGAGIVADSDPQRELEETRAKALGLLRALGVA